MPFLMLLHLLTKNICCCATEPWQPWAQSRMVMPQQSSAWPKFSSFEARLMAPAISQGYELGPTPCQCGCRVSGSWARISVQQRRRLRAARSLFAGSRGVCGMGTPEALLDANSCSAPGIQLLGKEADAAELSRAEAGWQCCRRVAFPPRILSHSQELPFLPQLADGPHSSSPHQQETCCSFCFSHQRHM